MRDRRKAEYSLARYGLIHVISGDPDRRADQDVDHVRVPDDLSALKCLVNTTWSMFRSRSCTRQSKQGLCQLSSLNFSPSGTQSSIIAPMISVMGTLAFCQSPG